MLHGIVINLFLPACAGPPGDDGVHGVGLSKGQDPGPGPLGHLKLVPDVLEGDLGPPQLKSSPFGGLIEVFACCYPYRLYLYSTLDSSK